MIGLSIHASRMYLFHPRLHHVASARIRALPQTTGGYCIECSSLSVMLHIDLPVGEAVSLLR